MKIPETWDECKTKEQKKVFMAELERIEKEEKTIVFHDVIYDLYKKQQRSPRIVFFNDSKKKVNVRIPELRKLIRVKPAEILKLEISKNFNIANEDIMVKIWDDDIILFASAPKNMKIK